MRPAIPAQTKWLVASALAGRLHSTASNVLIALAVQRWTGSFTTSGLVIAGLVLGQCVSSPLRGRAADRSPIRTLRVCGILYTTGLVVLAGLTRTESTTSAHWVAAGVAFTSGALLPPVAPVLRSAVARLAGDEVEAHRALAWEATYQEVIFIGGPPSALALATTTSPAVALALLGLSAACGVVVFSMVLRRLDARHRDRGARTGGERREDTSDASTEHESGPARLSATSLGVLATAYGVLLASLTAVTLIAVRTALDAGRPALAGILEAVLAAGSMAGGTLAGRGRLDRLGLAGRMTGMALALAALAAMCAATPSVVAIGSVLLVAGFWVSPSLAIHGVAVLRSSPRARRAEAFGWVNAAGLAVNAALTPIAGWLLDARGTPALAALAAGWVATGSALVAAAGSRLTNHVRLRIGVVEDVRRTASR